MKAEAQDRFLAFTEAHEGKTNFFYKDLRGLVTIGYGNLADPSSLVSGLPFVVGGRAATLADVFAAWQKVKLDATIDPASGGGSYARLTTVRATDETLTRLFWSKVASFESTLRGYFPEWDFWPWQAQLGAMSMAWAMGPGFPAKWPRFTQAARDQDWGAAATNCVMAEAGQNASFRDRNASNVALFQAAANGGSAPGGSFATMAAIVLVAGGVAFLAMNHRLVTSAIRAVGTRVWLA